MYSIEAPRQGASNEYPQHMFSSRKKKDISIFQMKKAPYLLLTGVQEEVTVVRVSGVIGSDSSVMK